MSFWISLLNDIAVSVFGSVLSASFCNALATARNRRIFWGCMVLLPLLLVLLPPPLLPLVLLPPPPPPPPQEARSKTDKAAINNSDFLNAIAESPLPELLQ